MSEAYLTNWLASQPCEERNHFHEIVLHEARISTELRGPAAAPVGPGLVERVRLALSRTTTVDHCECPAAA